MALLQRRSRAEKNLREGCEEIARQAGLTAAGRSSDEMLRVFINSERDSVRAAFSEFATETSPREAMEKAHSYSRTAATSMANVLDMHRDSEGFAEWAGFLMNALFDDLAEPAPMPRPTDSYYDEILTAAGFPESHENRLAVRRMAGEMFKLKAAQFVKGVAPALGDSLGIDAFLDSPSHLWPGRSISVEAANEWAQQILDDAAAQYPGAARYLGDVDTRARRIMLDGAEQSADSGGFLSGDRDVSLLEFWQS